MPRTLEFCQLVVRSVRRTIEVDLGGSRILFIHFGFSFFVLQDKKIEPAYSSVDYLPKSFVTVQYVPIYLFHEVFVELSCHHIKAAVFLISNYFLFPSRRTEHGSCPNLVAWQKNDAGDGALGD
jgi:hypothetical protein